MTWHQPIILLAILLVGWTLWLTIRSDRRRAAALAAFGVSGAAHPRLLLAARAVLVTVALVLLVIALAGPRFGEEVHEVRQEGIDLVIALDVSRSMLAEDVVPSRLERARVELGHLLERLPGSRVGVVLFAGEAFLQCPLTTDLATVRRFLSVAHPDLIRAQGTSIGDGVGVATTALRQQVPSEAPPADRRARAILVVSDGEDHPGRVDAALRAAEDEGIAVFAAGVGKPSGAAIPIYEGDRLAGFHADRSGRTVTTRLDEATLRHVGRSGGYVQIGRDRAVDELAASLAGLGTAALAAEEYVSYAERFQWPLALGLLLLTLERGLVRRRRQRTVTA